MVSAINPQTDDHLVEIGPGLGILTEALLESVPMMDVVELDRDLVPKLAQRFPDSGSGKRGKLRIHAADALQFDFSSLVRNHVPLRVVGNLPYNISTPLMFHLLENKIAIKDMHFMLQKEVVDRLAAEPGSKSYGRLSIMMQYHCSVEALFIVPPQAFSPPPKVESAVVRLTPRIEPDVQVNDIRVLEKILTAAFAQRRKTLRNNLKGIISAERLTDLGVDPSRRAESLSLTEFALIANSCLDIS